MTAVWPAPAASRPPFGVVAIAASIGGLRALGSVLAGLPAEFPAPILVVRHIPPTAPSLAAGLLGRQTALRVKDAEHGEVPRAGAVYLAPADYHLLVDPAGALALERSARVQFARPAADPLFASAARAYGPRAIAVVLTGSGSDGVAGVRAVKAAGGLVLAQSRATAEAFGMPGAAIASGSVAFTLSLRAIAPALIALCMAPGAVGIFGSLVAASSVA